MDVIASDSIQKQMGTIIEIRTMQRRMDQNSCNASILYLFAYGKTMCDDDFTTPKTKIFDDYASIIGYCLECIRFSRRENFSR